MEQINISVSLAFASELTFDQLAQLKRQVCELIENEALEGGALSADDNEVVDYAVTFTDDE